MDCLNVSIGERSYPIFIGESLLKDTKLWADLIQDRPFFIITDENVVQHAGDTFSDPRKRIVVPAGEAHKNLTTLTLILTRLTESHFPRDGVIIALGGGVIGDMAGFAAAIYQRGVDFIQVPTTTLAMLDSSVGGKTAVNLGSAKNNIGAFHQPKAVVMDLNTLKTLPTREYSAGLVEAIKHGLIRDAAFFDWICRHQEALIKRNIPTLTELIKRSCNIKAAIVAEDEKEQSLRMLLNFGHTFGHAIEAYSDYQDFKHGEAVAIGILCALRFAKANPVLTEKVTQLFSNLALPLEVPSHYSHDTLRELMQHDKKKRQGHLNLILLQQAGHAFIKQEELCKIHF